MNGLQHMCGGRGLPGRPGTSPVHRAYADSFWLGVAANFLGWMALTTSWTGTGTVTQLCRQRYGHICRQGLQRAGLVADVLLLECRAAVAILEASSPSLP